MTRPVKFAEDALRDLTIIHDYLTSIYREQGETPAAAAGHAARRIRAIVAAVDRIGVAPDRGARHEELGPDIRHLTLDRAIYYFIAPDGQGDRPVRILAIFFGGQEHQRRMQLRILRRD